MQDVWREVRLGWADARWTLYLAVLLLPALAIAMALACLIEGRLSEPSSPVALGLSASAALVSVYGAGLWDGFNGRLGRHAWAMTILVVVWRSIRSIRRETNRVPTAGQERRRKTRIRFAGHEVIVELIGVVQPTPFRGISQTIQRQLSLPMPPGTPRGVTIESARLAER